jgi:hypothetical protein
VEHWIADDAFHNSNEPCDAPKCHPHTRVAVLDNIMKWVIESEAEEDFMMWLFGPTELAEERGLLIGTFFFSRSSSRHRREISQIVSSQR